MPDLDPDSDVGFCTMSPASAEQVTVQIRTVLDRGWEYIALAYKGRAFVALGYATWDDYVDARFGDVRIAVPREHRNQVVAALAGVRMSVRAIAKLLGVGVGTVHRELSRSSGVPNGTPDGEDERPPTLGLDGKQYPSRRKSSDNRARRAVRSTRGTAESARGTCSRRAEHRIRDGGAGHRIATRAKTSPTASRIARSRSQSRRKSRAHRTSRVRRAAGARRRPRTSPVDLDAPLELICGWNRSSTSWHESSELVLALEAAIAGRERVVANVDLAGQVSRLGDDLSGGSADLRRWPPGSLRSPPRSEHTDDSSGEPAKARAADGLVVRGRPPFAMTPTSLLRNPSISSHAVRLWSVLASYTYGDQATDRPSRSQLATDVGWKSSRSVDTYLAELQVAGYLTIERQWRTDGGKARNLYILEWEPQGVDRPTARRKPGHPVDNSISAAQTHAQDPAHGGTDTETPRLWITLFPQLRPMRKILRMGSGDRSTHAQDSAHTHAQDSAHLGIELKTKKEPPPMDRLAAVGGPSGPPVGGESQKPDYTTHHSTAGLLGTLRRRLPGGLRRQLTTSALSARADALARMGWTDQALSDAVMSRVWDRAGPGAVMVWLQDLACDPPPQKRASQPDSRSQLIQLRARTRRRPRCGRASGFRISPPCPRTGGQPWPPGPAAHLTVGSAANEIGAGHARRTDEVRSGMQAANDRAGTPRLTASVPAAVSAWLCCHHRGSKAARDSPSGRAGVPGLVP